MDVQILFPVIEIFSNSSTQSDSPNCFKRKMPLIFDNGITSSIQMVKKKSVSNSELFHGGARGGNLCDTICENDDDFVDGNFPHAIDMEKNISLANNPSSVLNASDSPVVSVAVSPVALVVFQPCIQSYNLRPRRKLFKAVW